MRFQVPQFIEVEDKLFGPLTFKQFIYLVGAGAICVLLFTFLPKFFAIILSVPVALLGGALAFFKINDKPFISVVEAFFKYNINGKLYIWKKEEKKPVGTSTALPIEQMQVPKLSDSRLKDLSFELDVKANQNPITKDTI